MIDFSANLTFLFTERPFLERFAAASAAGFRGVEYLFPFEWPIEALADRLNTYALEQTLLNIAPGDWTRGDRGLACQPGRVKEFRAGVLKAIEYARALKCPRLHCVAGIVPGGEPVRRVERCYIDNVLYAAGLCAEHGIELLIEPINTDDIPRYFLDSFDKAMSLMNIMASQGGAQPKLQFDIYHCARIHGDVPEWIARCGERIAYFQIAGVPDRHEPDLGLLELEPVYEAIRELELESWIGCEYTPKDDTFDGLDWINAARVKLKN